MTAGKTEPHYIRCIKSNEHRLYAHKKGSFDPKLVLRQLLYAGVLELVNIRQNGYAFRPTISDFWADCKDKNLTGLAGVSNSSPPRKGILAVLLAITGKLPVPHGVPDADIDLSQYGPYTLGKNLVFGKATLQRTIDNWRVDHAMDMIQPWGRFYMMHNKYRRFEWALELMQLEWRRSLKERRLSAISPLLVSARKVARAVVAVQSLNTRRLLMAKKRQIKEAWATVSRVRRRYAAVKEWSKAASVTVALIDLTGMYVRHRRPVARSN